MPAGMSSTQSKLKKCVLSFFLMFEKTTAGDETKTIRVRPRMNSASLLKRNRPRLPLRFFQTISAGSVAGLATKIASLYMLMSSASSSLASANLKRVDLERSLGPELRRPKQVVMAVFIT